MPAVFIGHGTPLNALWDNEFTRRWAELGRTLPEPAAIVVVSAHWVTRGGAYVTAGAHPKVVYDMGGFPAKLYEVKYPAPGSPELAAELARTLETTHVELNGDWGFDHGTWSVLVHMYPRADIPVLQLSLDYSLPPERHLELGRELAFLRDRNVLLLGSGQIVHNLGLAGSRIEDVPPYEWAVEFDSIVKGAIEARDFAKAARLDGLGRLAHIAHPTYEHYLPLLYVLGAARSDDDLSWVCEGIVSGCHDMRSLLVA